MPARRVKRYILDSREFIRRLQEVGLTYEALGTVLDPPITKGAVGQRMKRGWTQSQLLELSDKVLWSMRKVKSRLVRDIANADTPDS